MRLTIKYFLVLFLLGFALEGFTQQSIYGKILNEEKEALNYATVTLLNPTDSLLQFFGVTNEKGAFQIKNIRPGTYIIQFSYVGMVTQYDRLAIPISNEDLGTILLEADPLEEVIVEAELIPIKFKKDTLEFDVKAFQTRPGAAAEELLRQLPGIEVDNAGNIRAEGEDVVRVLVDGKEFFDEDPKVATQNLPAKALSKVQVIDRKSAEAVFSGIDDGIREKTINLQLKEDHKRGYFGAVNARYGTEERAQISTNIYRFSPKTQSALLGNYNNINQYGFTNKDNNQFGQDNKGVNKVLAGGFNFSYNPSSENRYFISYLGSRRRKDLEEDLFSINFLEAGPYQQNEQINELETNSPHKLNLGIRHSFSDKEQLVMDASLNWSTNEMERTLLVNSSINEKAINQLDNQSFSNSDRLNLFTKATYLRKLKSDKTQIKAEFSGRIEADNDAIDWTNLRTLFDPFNQLGIQQFQNNDQQNTQWYFTPSILQKLSPNLSLNLGIRFGVDNKELIRTEGILEDSTGITQRAIPRFSTSMMYTRPTLIINRSGKLSQLNIEIAGQLSQFNRSEELLNLPRKHYFFCLPNVNYQLEYKSGRRINLNYRTDYTFPLPNQLLPISNELNQLNILVGNPDLEPERSQSLFGRWTIFDQFSFTTLAIQIGGTYIKDRIRWTQIIDNFLVKTNTPINVESDWNLNAGIELSTPIRSLGLNFNSSISEVWNQGIIFLNSQKNINTNFSHSLNLSIENRKNTQLAIRVGANFNWTDSRFSIANDQNNVYFNSRYSSRFRYTPNKKWNFEVQGELVNFNARSFEESVLVPLLNAEISYFFLPSEKAALTINAFDILNQYQGVRRTSTNNFLLQNTWNTLTQYLMLGLRVEFR